ncbi:MAG TPA: hypothetical protein VNQ14_10340 [Woeseiaceae bacterium]|nr:hypothetical protein [Woeseiaceae bacterium]
MKAVPMIATTLLAAGCAAGMPDSAERESRQYLRENARIEAIEGLQQLTRSCRQVGGVVHMPRQSSGRFGPTAFEMRGASCDRHPGLAQPL